MGTKRQNGGGGGGALSACAKYLSPSYYLRRPRRLAFVSLVFVVGLFVFMDRQNQAREIEVLMSRLKEMESEKGVLVKELNSKSAESARKGDSKGGLKERKSDPLILGVGNSGSTDPDTIFLKEELPRKVLRERIKLPLAERTRVLEKGTVVVDDARGRESENGQDGEGGAGETEVKDVSAEERGAGGAGEEGGGGEVGGDKGGSGGGEEGSGSTEEETEEERDEAERRREAIKEAMVHAWKAYETYAWGMDELLPRSRQGENTFAGMGATIIDALDTLHIMGLQDQFQKGRNWVEKNLSFDKDNEVSVFETTIRVLGGLLSAYDLSGDRMFLKKAVDLGDRLLPAFNSPSGIPFNSVNLHSGSGSSPSWTGGSTILADLGTTQVEMITLSQRTGDPKYARKSEGAISVLARNFPPDGLLPIYISPHTGRATGGQITFGAMGDSFYEYLIKVWVLGGKTPAVQRYRDMWDRSVKGLYTLVKNSTDGYTYVAEKNGGSLNDKMDHLLCFVPGMLVLGAQREDSQKQLELAKQVGRTCYQFYNSTASKLSGENYYFSTQGLHVGQQYNILRPETVEALMYLWRATKDPIYREWGWNIWLAFEKHCKLESGFTGLLNVDSPVPAKDDKMQTFFLAETLKYLFLLFSPEDVMPLDKWVFNTEAHPMRITPRTGDSADILEPQRSIVDTSNNQNESQ